MAARDPCSLVAQAFAQAVNLTLQADGLLLDHTGTRFRLVQQLLVEGGDSLCVLGIQRCGGIRALAVEFCRQVAEVLACSI